MKKNFYFLLQNYNFNTLRAFLFVTWTLRYVTYRALFTLNNDLVTSAKPQVMVGWGKMSTFAFEIKTQEQ